MLCALVVLKNRYYPVVRGNGSLRGADSLAALGG